MKNPHLWHKSGFSNDFAPKTFGLSCCHNLPWILGRHGSLNVPIEHHPTIRYMVSTMATIRWCPIYPKWDSYQPLEDIIVVLDCWCRNEGTQSSNGLRCWRTWLRTAASQPAMFINFHPSHNIWAPRISKPEINYVLAWFLLVSICMVKSL